MLTIGQTIPFTPQITYELDDGTTGTIPNYFLEWYKSFYDANEMYNSSPVGNGETVEREMFSYSWNLSIDLPLDQFSTDNVSIECDGISMSENWSNDGRFRHVTVFGYYYPASVNATNASVSIGDYVCAGRQGLTIIPDPGYAISSVTALFPSWYGDNPREVEYKDGQYFIYFEQCASEITIECAPAVEITEAILTMGAVYEQAYEFTIDSSDDAPYTV